MVKITNEFSTTWTDDKGRLHNDDGPAFEDVGGYKSWWFHGTRHRIDGPAIENPDGSGFFYLHDAQYMNIDNYFKKVSLSNEEKIILKLRYG